MTADRTAYILQVLLLLVMLRKSLAVTYRRFRLYHGIGHLVVMLLLSRIKHDFQAAIAVE